MSKKLLTHFVSLTYNLGKNCGAVFAISTGTNIVSPASDYTASVLLQVKLSTTPK
jgi:hypothetical protein